ncbi:triple tyrosine motif-containing protein [Flavobacterium sp.]|uniref:triple tyrosine motif-containing protein n=1 Tax=Flavobacterium sp. TaxID=239 RepID=UPI0038CFBA1F
MPKIFCFRIVSFFILVFSINGISQELPPIVKFNPVTYNAGNQNWMVTQDKNHLLYFANNEGLLEYNGTNWSLYKSPNETIIRSVKAIDDLIYTGSYMEFGYWKRMTNGRLVYNSLSKNIKNKIIDDEQFWNILNIDKWVIFQSLNRIYIYDTETKKFKIITPKNSITKAFKTDNAIYFQVINEGLFEIENGQSKLVSNDVALKNYKIVNVFQDGNGLIIHTQTNGFYRLNENIVSGYSIAANSELSGTSIYSSCQLNNGNFAIGTISDGIYIVSRFGKIDYHISQTNGLSNNTVLSLFEDQDKNLWIGLDNGINCINLQSPIKSFLDESGKLGTVYASILYQGKLYVGTNQGLFYKQNNSFDTFQFISGTKGQVWSLYIYQGTLFCGHDSGTFIVSNTSAKCIFNQSGTWKFQSVANKNILLQGNYYGISVLEKINNQWSFKNKISGFDYSSKYFELNSKNVIYVSHEYKGIFKFKAHDNYTKAGNIVRLEAPKKGKNASLIKYNNTIYYAYKEGVFKLNENKNVFEKDTQLSKIFTNDEFTSGKMIVDQSNKIWFFSKHYIYYFYRNKFNYELKQNSIPIPSKFTNALTGYENITQLNDFCYLIGTTDGYNTININDLSFKNNKVFISSISVNSLNNKASYISISNEGELKHDENNISINFSVAQFNKYIAAEYQYKLEGFQDNWSQWSNKSAVSFKNLSPGDYKFVVRSKIANTNLENTAVYNFTILKPWYLTNLALFIYLIGLIYLAYWINKRYQDYYHQQRAKLIEENNLLLEIKELENEQQLMKLRNDQLSMDVDAKNKELAVSTMSLIKKDELLSLIKEDLKKTTDEENKNTSIKSVISKISKNISNEDTWNVFKEAFDTVDKDFLKKLKSLHPALTPNDLRLCAYLRLNLSSKEIAPLLNISVRSVEIKRYRLRKKMNLSHENGLAEYILSV